MIMRFSRLALAALSTSALAVFAAACSDPVPPTPQGAWSAQLIHDSSSCTIIGHAAQIGSVTSNSKDKVLVNGGLEGAEISCQVTGTGTFSVDGSASLDGKGVSISIPAIDSSATKASPAPGSVSFASAETAGPYSSPTATPCNFYFLPNTGEGVVSGRIWVAFSCPMVVRDMSTCALSESFAIFENCTE
jgi:hypothetical protein